MQAADQQQAHSSPNGAPKPEQAAPQADLAGPEPEAADTAAGKDTTQKPIEVVSFIGSGGLIGDRPHAIVAEAIRQLLVNEAKWPASLGVKDVAARANEVSKDWDAEIGFTPKRIGVLVRSLVDCL